mgnify:CR=1 FL=1|tara:strand:+ start:1059 stop:1748 length:690 start_codon:yes stop_codon:yes gene_type:complete
MAGKSKIIKGLSDVAQRWFNSLDETTGHRSELLADWPEFVEKVKNLDKEAPFLFSQYEPKVLRSALAESAEGLSDLAVMNPEDFRMLAARNIEMWMEGGKNFSPDDPITQEIYSKINEYADMYEKGIQFDDIPYFRVDNPHKGVAQVVGHQGRHRKRAQEKIGSDLSLVRILRPENYKIKGSGDVLHTELSSHQSAESGGGKSYKPIDDVLKFLSLGGTSGALGNLVDE